MLGATLLEAVDGDPDRVGLRVWLGDTVVFDSGGRTPLGGGSLRVRSST